MGKKNSKRAFEAGRANLWLMDPDDLKIIVDPKHPLFDPRALEPPDPRLVASIRSIGIKVPISIIKDGEDAIVVAGRRRVTAAREANRLNKAQGLPEIRVPAVLARDDERGAARTMIVENAIRNDDTLMQKAEKARRMVNDLGYSVKETAELFGVGEATIKQWLDLIALHPKVQKAVADGDVRMSDAVKQLAKIPREEQANAMEKLMEVAPPTRKAKREGKASGAKPKAVTPGARLRMLSRYTDEHPQALSAQASVLVNWMCGDATDGELVERFPHLNEMLAS